MPPAIIIGILIISYLIGSIPFGYILVKIVRGIDIREHGSKNIGATNAWRVAGKPFGIAVFIFDMLKGFIPTLVVYRIMSDSFIQIFGTSVELNRSIMTIICGIAVILGHIFPLYLRFKGGKAAATSCGVFLVLAPQALAVAVAVWMATVFISRFVSLGTMVGAAALVVSIIVIYEQPFGNEICLTGFSILMCIIILIRHISNIKRLVNGTENRIGGIRTR